MKSSDLLFMMNVFATILLSYLTLVSRAEFISHLKCDHMSQWKHRANATCQRIDLYHCLYDINTKQWREKCFHPVDLPPGYHSVLSGLLHARPCEDKTFSPYISWSNEGSECQYQKHLCSEEGQIVVDKGSYVRDVKCRCDYRKGYAFVIKQKNECSCSPSVEDCSCYRKKCQNSSFILSQDYICLNMNHISRVMKCPPIADRRHLRTGHEFTLESDDNEEMKGKSSVFSFSGLSLFVPLFLLENTQKKCNPFNNFENENKHIFCPFKGDNKMTKSFERHHHLMKFPFLFIMSFGIACFIGISFILILWCISTGRKKEDNQNILENVKKLSKFTLLKNTIKKTSVIVLTGREGTGKNTVAKCLFGLYSKKRCSIIHIKKNNLRHGLPKECHVIVDSQGTVLTFDTSIKAYFDNIKGTKLIIVVEDFPPKLNILLKKCVNDQTQTIFNLDDQTFYNTKDKENILKLHMQMNNIYSEDEMTQLQLKEMSENVIISKSLFQDLLIEETMLGFPLMCASLCSHKDHIRQGIRYFRQPPVPLMTEIDDLREKGESDDISAIQYCLFVSVLLCLNMSFTDGNLQASILMTMRHIYPERSVSFDLHLIPTFVFHLMPHYFESSKSELRFSHHTIYQAVLITYCNTHPQPNFCKCNMGDIILFLRPPNYKPLTDEIVLDVDLDQSDFVTLVTNSLMLGNLNADNIIKQLKCFIEYHKDTQLLQLIINHIKSDQTYTQQFRFNVFRELAKYARMFEDVEVCDYFLSWECAWLNRKEKVDELKACTEDRFACDAGVNGKVLQPRIYI